MCVQIVVQGVLNVGCAMTDIRIFFEKTDRAKYISHLDLQRTFQRALARSNLPVWYTEGFNPRIYVTFGQPLSLGFESLYEVVDLRFVAEVDFAQAKERLNAVMPRGLSIVDIDYPKNKPSAIDEAHFIIKLIDTYKNDIEKLLNQEKIVVSKKSKKGFVETDIKPYLSDYTLSQSGNDTIMEIYLPCGINLNINPTLFIKHFEGILERKIYAEIKRTMLYIPERKKFQ